MASASGKREQIFFMAIYYFVPERMRFQVIGRKSCVAPVPARCRFCEFCEFVNNFSGRFLPVSQFNPTSATGAGVKSSGGILLGF
jgi:hypothetical protein